MWLPVSVALLVALRHEPVFAPQVNATLALIGVWSLSVAAANLIPYRTGDAYSDGAVVLQLLSDGALADLHLALARVAPVSLSPTRPRDYDIEAIQRAAGEVAQGARHFCSGSSPSATRSTRQARAGRRGACECRVGVVCNRHPIFPPSCTPHLSLETRWCATMPRARASGGIGCRPETQASERRLLASPSALYWIEGNLDEARCAWEKSNSLAAQLPKAGAYDFSRDCCALLHQ